MHPYMHTYIYTNTHTRAYTCYVCTFAVLIYSPFSPFCLPLGGGKSPRWDDEPTLGFNPIHAYIHTRTRIRTYIHTYCACVHACIDRCIHTYMHTHTRIRTYIHTYTRTYDTHTNTYIHAYVHTYARIYLPLFCLVYFSSGGGRGPRRDDEPTLWFNRIHTCIHARTRIRTYMHTYCTCVHTDLHSNPFLFLFPSGGWRSPSWDDEPTLGDTSQ